MANLQISPEDDPPKIALLPLPYQLPPIKNVVTKKSRLSSNRSLGAGASSSNLNYR